MTSSAEFLEQLRATFREEAQEHLERIARRLVELARVRAFAEAAPLVEDAFRAAHSLKGAAGAVEFAQIESACQALEETLSAWKRGERMPPAPQLEHAHRQLDGLASLLGASASAIVAVAADGAAQTTPGQAADEPAAGSAQAARRSGPTTVRVRHDLLQSNLLQAEEMLAAKLVAERHAQAMQAIADELRHASRGDAALRDRVARFATAIEQDRAAIGRQVDELIARAKSLLLVPFSTVSASLPKLVRDLCQEQGKQADLLITGEGIALDKRLLDNLRDPLLHLMRNCVVHGIEFPSERRARGKPERGRIALTVQQSANGQVRVELADDGAGIDPQRIRSTAVARGLLTAQEATALSDAQAQALVFRSDLSTSARVSELAGRGLGLAIVQQKAAELGGEASLESTPGRGTVFRLMLPAPRATLRGVLLRAGADLLVLPTASVERTLRVRADQVRDLEGRHVMLVQAERVPLVPLAHVLGLSGADTTQPARGTRTAVVLGDGAGRIALEVDEVLDECELLARPLQPPLLGLPLLASAAVLADGRIAFVLDAPQLLAAAHAAPAPSPTPGPAHEEATAAAPRSILVADDSITSRMLLRATLEAAGFRVSVAVDGMDAWHRLREQPYDLLVSDVEMPRMDGLELTARVRADPALARLPVVLVTALASDADRERGVDAGASAYVVKGTLGEGALPDVVRRLL